MGDATRRQISGGLWRGRTRGKRRDQGIAGEGATVHLVGRTLADLDAVATEIHAAGERAVTAALDVDDQGAVEHPASAVITADRHLDVSFNAVGMNAVQNVPLVEMALDDFMVPITEATRRHFITATAAERMANQGSGTIVMLSSSAAAEWRHQMGGFDLACASIEAFTRSLAGEVGQHGVRVVCIRPNFAPETAGMTDDEIPALVGDTSLGRLPRLAEVAGAAVFAASDHAGAMTGAILDLTCGAIAD